LEQVADNGKTYEEVLKDNYVISGAQIGAENGVTYLALAGNGNISIDSSGTFLLGNKTTPTTLIFGKNPSDGTYKIAAVVIADSPLTDYGSYQYWSVVTEN